MTKLMPLTLVALILGSAQAFAGWQQSTVLFQANQATDQNAIVTALKNVLELRDELIAMELASPVKLTVTRISTTIFQFKWENDATCKVPNPNEVPLAIVENSSASYRLNSPPGAEYQITKKGSLPNPCAH